MYNVTNKLSLQLNQNKNEAMADLKYSCPPLIIFSSKGLIPFTQKHSSLQAPMALPATAYINNAVSTLDCAVRDGEWLAWCQIYEMMPLSLLYYSSKEYAGSPLKNKPKIDSMSSYVVAPNNTTLICCRNNVVVAEISLAKCRNEEMKSKPSPSLRIR